MIEVPNGWLGMDDARESVGAEYLLPDGRRVRAVTDDMRPVAWRPRDEPANPAIADFSTLKAGIR